MVKLRVGQKLLLLICITIVLFSPVTSAELAAASSPVPQLSEDPGTSQLQGTTGEDAETLAPDSRLSPAAAQRQKRSKSLSLSQLMRKYPETLMTKGPRNKIIALTFDDVPDPRFTPQLLEVLRSNQVKATFFVVGSRAEKHPALVERMIREGHVVGNHSYNHPSFGKLSVNEFRNQILQTENIISAVAGYKPRLIRPPYGEISEQQLQWAKKHGYKLINWNVDSLDWRGLPKAQVRNNILAHAGKGAIVLQHGGGGRGSDLRGTIQALPEVIRIMRKRGYTFVTVPEMLQITKDK